MFEKIIEILRLIMRLVEGGMTLEQIEAKLKGGDPLPPEPVTRMFEVTAEKSNARFAWKTNANGRMIPQIYPADNALVKDRVQFVKGMRVNVFPDVIKADGGTPYYRIADEVNKGGVWIKIPLYLMAEDGRIV